MTVFKPTDNTGEWPEDVLDVTGVIFPYESDSEKGETDDQRKD